MDIGQKIYELRLLHGLTQKELADRTELSKGFISQLERNLTSPSIATLCDILECLGTDLRGFFSDSSDDKIVFPASDTFVKEDPEAGVTIRWLVPSCQKNQMEPILITLEPGASAPFHDPHEGEEFGYVLSGSVLVHRGALKKRVRRGDCFSFKSGVAHGLSNPGKTQARILWVAHPPSF